jgi:hypothetical protein
LIVIVDISHLSRDLPWFYWGLPLFYSRTLNISTGARSHLRETGLRGEKIMGDSWDFTRFSMGFFSKNDDYNIVKKIILL